jgi:hypothetical protein
VGGFCTLFCDAINGVHTTDWDARESERMLEGDARESVKFLNQLSNWYGSGDERGLTRIEAVRHGEGRLDADRLEQTLSDESRIG